MKEQLEQALRKAVVALGIDGDSVRLEYTENPEHGDYSSNVALASAKKLKANPRELAEKVIAEFKKIQPDFIQSVSMAGAGFVNFFVKDESLVREVIQISGNKEYGWGNSGKSKKIMVEYTDPNPFKEFHIGHLMSNAIGESVSRLIEASGSKVIRANWQGDVGPHVAKAVWGAMQEGKKQSPFGLSKEAKNNAVFWGKAYAHGAEAYETDEKAKKEIEDINKKIYAKSDPEINKLYEKGRAESLEAFEAIYKRLDTKFNNYFFEGTEGRNGEAIVKESLKKGIFVESEGAIIFKGEDHGLHTRVFITSHGLPTYETKELGLNTEKFKLYPDLSQSVIITGNEQNDYFKVLLKVFSLIRPEIAEKTKHLSHGLMRFASGKMSSRTGKVIAAESLIDEIKTMVADKMKGREFSKEEADEVADAVAIGAIKYTILRQAIGGDVIFDSAKSISFEGDSGPYLQYSAVRAGAVLEKAKAEGINPPPLAKLGVPPLQGGLETKVKSGESPFLKGVPEGRGIIQSPAKVGFLEKLIARFPDIVERARDEYAPQLVANYLTNLAAAFNGFYASQVIVDAKNPASAYYVALTQAFRTVMMNGLWTLGIKVPRKM